MSLEHDCETSPVNNLCPVLVKPSTRVLSLADGLYELLLETFGWLVRFLHNMIQT